MALGLNSGMSFLRINDLQLAQKGEFSFWIFGFLVKIEEVDGVQIENKLKKIIKRNLLELSGH